MFVRYVLMWLLTFCSLVSFAQTQKISGKILNERNEPLAGVSVKVIGTNIGTSTDVEGRFSLNLDTQQKYELDISVIGYETKTVSDVEVLPNQVNELNAVLAIKSKVNEEVVVTARRSSARLETAASVISFQRNTN